MEHQRHIQFLRREIGEEERLAADAVDGTAGAEHARRARDCRDQLRRLVTRQLGATPGSWYAMLNPAAE